MTVFVVRLLIVVVAFFVALATGPVIGHEFPPWLVLTLWALLAALGLHAQARHR